MAGAARGGQAGGTAPGSQTRVFGPAATAAGVLHNAALAALQLPAATPRPDQFVYSEVVQRWAGAGPHSTDQQWLSVDGTRFGLVKIVGNPNPSWSSTIPCPAPMMRAYLLLPFLPQERSSVTSADLLVMAEKLMISHYLLPKQQAAMYEMLAHLPGLTVVPRVTSMQGAAGIGVEARSYKGSAYTIIFDPKSYAPLGMNWTHLGKPAGEVQVKLAIVSSAGQLP